MRCRKCWYALRASTCDHCPECGAELLKTKVWPIGKPNRTKLTHFLILWFWLGFMGTAICTSIYSDYSYDIAKHYQIDQDIALVADPHSGTHDFAVITLGGQGWELFPGEHEDLTIPVSWASIRIFSVDVEIQAMTFDTDTMTTIAHPVPHVENAQARIRSSNGPHLKPGTTVTPELLASFHPSGIDAQTDRELLAEMAFLIEAINTYKTQAPLLFAPEVTDRISNELRTAAESNGEYDYIATETDYFYRYNFDNLPMWTSLIILGILIMALGVIFIRKWCYSRDAVAWQPDHDYNKTA